MTTWPELARSPQLIRFLEYIVHRQLEGDAQSIKAYSIAVDVFGRGADFDPQHDPIVRVQARRLRALLDEYYRGPGAEDTVKIVLPVGRYVPEFIAVAASGEQRTRRVREAETVETNAAPTEGRRKGQVTMSWLVLLVIAFGIASITYAVTTWDMRRAPAAEAAGMIQRPYLRIMEFQNLTEEPKVASAVAGLAVALVNRLQPFMFLSVEYGGRGEVNSEPPQTSGFELTGIVRRDPAVPGNFQYSVILTDLSNSSVVWNRTLVLSEEQLSDPGRIDRLSIDLVAVVGNPRGPLHTRARQYLSRNALTGFENHYLCRVLFSLYRENSTLGAAERARSCYRALPRSEQEHPIALAAMASLTAEQSEFGNTTAVSRLENYRAAGDMLTEAVRKAPTSSLVWEQKARLYEVQNEHALAEAAYGTALQSNPSNLDGLAAHALHVAFMGELDKAIILAQRALDAFTIIPDWYYGVPALQALRESDFVKAARFAEIYARADREIGPILVILAAQGLRDEAQVARQLPRVLEAPNFRNVGIITQLSRRIPDAALVERMRAALVEAGVPPLSLVAAF